VTPPAAYTTSSGVADATLQTLPGAPFALGAGSRGGVFSVAGGPTFQVDVPLDAASGFGFISIDASRDVVSLGEHFQFDVRVENPGVLGAPLGVDVTVVLPIGIRFLPGSVRIDDAKSPDPVVSPDGRTLTWTLPASALPVVTHIRFTVKVTPRGRADRPEPPRAPGAGRSIWRTPSRIRVEDLGANSAYVLGRVSRARATTTSPAEAVPGVRVCTWRTGRSRSPTRTATTTSPA
jgi:uncharacterized repeat protein (TIGR01451 family)